MRSRRQEQADDEGPKPPAWFSAEYLDAFREELVKMTGDPPTVKIEEVFWFRPTGDERCRATG